MQHIAPLKYLTFHPANVAASLSRYPDRVAMYNSTHLATIPRDMAFVPRTVYAPAATLAQDLNVLYNNFLHRISGADHKARLESFYAGQAGSYDVYRHRFLHGRVPMIEAMPTPKGGVWVDLGGGTGANMELLGPHLRTFSKVVLLDLTPSLLEVARARIAANKWGDFVSTVEGDACVKGLPGMPRAGTADLVTMSYSLTMIPDWKAALENVRFFVLLAAPPAYWPLFVLFSQTLSSPFLTPHFFPFYPPFPRPTPSSSLAATLQCLTLLSRPRTPCSRASSGLQCWGWMACAPPQSTLPTWTASFSACTAWWRRGASPTWGRCCWRVGVRWGRAPATC